MDNNFQEAKRLLEEHRQSLLEQRPPSRLSRKPTEGVYTYKEINHVLTQVIERNGPSGLVDALLSLGGDVNLSRRRGNKIWNLVRGKGQQPERNDILLKATANSSAEVVHSLARRADQDNLNSALHVALLRGDLAILKALLVHGADPADHHTEFEDVARQNNLDILDALLSGVKKPCLPCRSSALHIALRNGSSDALRMLMKSGADPNHDGATALSAAAEVLRPDLFAILLSGPTWPAPASLDTAVGRAYMAMQGQDTDAGREIIDMGLSASAQGPFTDDLFTEGFPRIVQSGQLRLLDTLLKFNKPSGHYETVTILQAMEIGDKQLLVKLLNLGPAPTSLALAVAQAMKLSASASRNDTIKILISSGAQGECIANALITTVQLLVGRPASTDQDSKLNRELFDLLLREGRADINYRGGEALQVAVRALALDISLQIASQRPSPDILGAALQVALSIQDAEMKESMVELLMGNDIADSAVNRSLMEAVRAGPGNSYLVQILLSRANVDYNSGEVFTYAIRHRDVNTLQLLLLQHPNSRSLSTAVDAALSLDRQGRHGVFEVLIPHLNREHLSHAFRASGLGASNPDLNFMRMLLQAGAAVTVDNGACIKQAARNLDIDALVLLAEFSSYNEGIYTAAFAELLESGNHWLSSDHLDAVQLILSHGASGPVLNTALFTVIDHLAGDEAKTHLTRKLLEMLLAADVNVNHDSGKVIRLAAKKGDVGVLRQLLNSGASTQTASFALSTAILAGHAEQKLLKLVDTFTNKEGAALNVDMPLPLPGKLPPLFLCLQAYPKSTSLVDRMFSAGCNPEQTVESRVYGEKKEYEDDPGVTIPDEEPLSVIQWALLQPNSRISSDVINTIINYATNVSYATPSSRATSLMLAAKLGRVDVCRKLLDAGAKPAAKDIFGRSALFYASRNGNADVVQLLLAQKPVINDGSLHEASRGFHAGVMQLLLNAKHDANYRSSKHGGRTALAEMALHGRVPDDVSDAEEAIDVLKAAGADPIIQIHGKSVIYLALENARPIPITQVLLDRLLYKTINDNGNIYRSGKLHYSPTIYLSKNTSHPSRAASTQLLTLLRHHGAKDIFYSSDPHKPQPSGAVGLPPEIALAERSREAREAHAERTRQAREAQLAEEEQLHKMALRREAETHNHRAALGESSHYASLRHRGEAADLDVSIARTAHQSDTSATLNSFAARREIGWARHKDEMAMELDRAATGNYIAVGTEGVKRGIGWDRHRDRLAMTAEQREADLAHWAQTHSTRLDLEQDEYAQAYYIREWDDEQTGRFEAGKHQRKLAERADEETDAWYYREWKDEQNGRFREGEHQRKLGERADEETDAWYYREWKDEQNGRFKAGEHQRKLGERADEETDAWYYREWRDEQNGRFAEGRQQRKIAALDSEAWAAAEHRQWNNGVDIENRRAVNEEEAWRLRTEYYAALEYEQGRVDQERIGTGWVEVDSETAELANRIAWNQYNAANGYGQEGQRMIEWAG